ncbi:MAG: hypothetical protein WCA77_05970, partial [Thermoplasmata archaeon]
APGRDEAARFGGGLTNALRSAAGLRLTWTMVWETGDPPRVVVATSDPRGRNWVEGAVGTAFGPGHWRFTRVQLDPWAIHRPRVGQPRVIEPRAMISPIPTSWAEPVLLHLKSFPKGLRAIWELQPVVPVPVRWWSNLLDGWDRRPALPARQLPLGSHGPSVDMQRTSEDPLLWSVRLRTEAGSPQLVPELPAFEHLISESFRSIRGPLRFRTVSRPRGTTVDPWLASEHEVAGLWPRPGIRLGAGEGADSGGGPHWNLGESTSGRTLRLEYSPSEGSHLMAVGETGMGKSSVLLGLSREAVKTSNLILMDPIGDTARRFLRDLDSEALQRTVWISPQDSPVSLNALIAPDAACQPDAFDRTIGELMGALRRIRATHYGEVPYWGPRIEETLHDVLDLIARCPGGTLTDATAVLRNAPIECGPVPADQVAAWKALHRRILERPEDVEGARRLLAEVTRSAVLRRLLSAREPDWSLSDVETPGRITVFCGDAPFVGEVTARYLLTFYSALLWARLLGRSPQQKLCWVLDEMQWYAPESLVDAFEVSRRLNVHIWAATQSLTSLPVNLREAVDANVADWIVFRCGADDARRLARGDPQLIRELSAPDERGWAVWLPRKSHHVERMRLREMPSTGTVLQRPLAPPHGLRLPAREASPVRDEGISRSYAKVYLRDLGLADDPASARARAMGGRWGRRGWIVDSGRDDRGAFWLVRPEAVSEFTTPLRAPPPSDQNATAASRTADPTDVRA